MHPELSSTVMTSNTLLCSFYKFIPTLQPMWLGALKTTVTVIASWCSPHCVLKGINRWQVPSILGNKVGRNTVGSCGVLKLHQPFDGLAPLSSWVSGQGKS